MPIYLLFNIKWFSYFIILVLESTDIVKFCEGLIYSLRLIIIVSLIFFILFKIIVTLQYRCNIFFPTIIPLFIECHPT